MSSTNIFDISVGGELVLCHGNSFNCNPFKITVGELELTHLEIILSDQSSQTNVELQGYTAGMPIKSILTPEFSEKSVTLLKLSDDLFLKVKAQSVTYSFEDEGSQIKVTIKINSASVPCDKSYLIIEKFSADGETEWV